MYFFLFYVMTLFDLSAILVFLLFIACSIIFSLYVNCSLLIIEKRGILKKKTVELSILYICVSHRKKLGTSIQKSMYPSLSYYFTI